MKFKFGYLLASTCLMCSVGFYIKSINKHKNVSSQNTSSFAVNKKHDSIKAIVLQKSVTSYNKPLVKSSANNNIAKPILTNNTLKKPITPLNSKYLLQANENNKSLHQKAENTQERWRHEFEMLKDPSTGVIPKDASEKAFKAAQIAKLKAETAQANRTNTLNFNIVPRGPNNFGGRTRAIGIDIRNSQIMLAGGVSSGVFRSTNAGATWVRVSPTGQIHNVTALVQDPRVGFQDTWYYGTGEASGNSASLGSAYRGHGIYKSIDNGLTWQPLTTTQSVLESFDNAFDYTHKLVIDPTNGNIYAAASNTIQRSTNGGATWSAVLGTYTTSNYTDVIVTPTGVIYAALEGEDVNEGLYRSTTGALGTFTKIAGTISGIVTPAAWSTANNYGRMVLAYAPSNPDIVYILYHNNLTSNCTTPLTEAKLFKYVHSTTTFTNLSGNLPNEAGCSSGNDPFAVQGGYDLVVAVKPNDPNTVFIGGTNAYRSTDGFTTNTNTRRIGGYASAASYAKYPNHHPDIHSFVFATNDNNTLYCGNDGGIQKADISTTNVVWTSLNNNYVTFQYYHVDLNPNTAGGTVLGGGAQDNGTTICETATTHFEEFSGDGCQTQFINYTNSSNYKIIVATQFGNIYNNTATTATPIKPAGSGNGQFVTYFNIDADNTDNLYYASNANLYRTRIASTINATTVTANSNTGWQNLTSLGISGNISYMASSRNAAYANAAYTATNTNRKLYIVTSTGKVYRFNDPAYATTAAVDITPVAPIATSGYASCVAVNPLNDNEIMVTFANYGVNSIYHTLNANAATPTWAVVEGPAGTAVTLSSVRSCVITTIGSIKTYLVGTSTGLYSTQALSGATTQWDKEGVQPINFALCSSMRLRVTDNKVALGTHGNGMFELQLTPVTLALQLANFTATTNNTNAVLNWATTTTTAYKQFVVEYSANGTNFIAINSSLAQQNNLNYTHTHLNANQIGSKIYYRLKLIGNNNNITYSKIQFVIFTTNNAIVHAIYPNPSKGLFNINIGNITSPLAYTITNNTGQIITKNKFITSGTQTINLNNYASGVYVIIFSNKQKFTLIKN